MTTTNDITTASTNELAPANRQLAELSATANAAHQRVFKAAGEGLLAAFEAGQALLQARKVCFGHFMAWLPKNFDASLRTAERYMKFAEECHSFGGLDLTRVSSMTPQKLGNIWSQVLGRRGAKKARPLPLPSDEPAAIAGASAGATAALPSAPAIERAAEPLDELGDSDAPVDLMPTVVPLLAELIERCRRIATGDDGYEGVYADDLAEKLESHYADLLDYMEYRREWRGGAG